MFRIFSIIVLTINVLARDTEFIECFMDFLKLQENAVHLNIFTNSKTRKIFISD